MGNTTKTPESLERTTRTTRVTSPKEIERYHAKRREMEGYVAWSLPNGVEPFDAAVDGLVMSAQRKLSAGDVIEVRATEYWNHHGGLKQGELNGNAVFRYNVLGDGNGGLSAELEGEAPPQYPKFVGDIVPGVEKIGGNDSNYVYCSVRLAVTRKVDEKKEAESTKGFMPPAEVDAALAKFFGE